MRAKVITPNIARITLDNKYFILLVFEICYFRFYDFMAKFEVRNEVNSESYRSNRIYLQYIVLNLLFVAYSDNFAIINILKSPQLVILFIYLILQY